MKNKRIFITGGTGYIGRILVRDFYDSNEITVFSRHEADQVVLQKEFPKIICRVGDIRNYELLKKVSHGCNVGVFCASLKHVGVVNRNVGEAQEIIIQGALNSRRVAIENRFESACFVSTDKSRLPVTLYGAMKFVAGEAFIWNAEEVHGTALSTVILGNIMNSTGSVIPMIFRAVESGEQMQLHSLAMSRFAMMDYRVSPAISKALELRGFNLVPALKSFMVKDLFEIYHQKFGLKYRVSNSSGMVERDHEMLISKEDAPRTTNLAEYYIIHHQKKVERPAMLINGEYSTLDHLMSIGELDSLLKKYDYFVPKSLLALTDQ